LPLSHDEVVHGKKSLLAQMPGDLWQRFANLRLLYSYMWTHPGKKLLYMGSDFGQWNEWNHDAELQWDLLQWESHSGIKKMVADANALLNREPSLYEVDFDKSGFEWIECNARQDSLLAYIRKAKDPNDFLLVVHNFTPVVRENYPIGVPRGGWYQEVFNSDSKYYGGSNLGNFPGRMAEEPGWHFRPFQVKLTIPPLATVVLKPERIETVNGSSN
jgi:1,4-alpha-glucan branching enzyme